MTCFNFARHSAILQTSQDIKQVIVGKCLLGKYNKHASNEVTQGDERDPRLNWKYAHHKRQYSPFLFLTVRVFFLVKPSLTKHFSLTFILSNTEAEGRCAWANQKLCQQCNQSHPDASRALADLLQKGQRVSVLAGTQRVGATSV